MTRGVLMVSGGLLAAAIGGCAASQPGGAEPGLWDRTRAGAALQLADEHISGGKFDQARALLAAHADGDDQRVQLALVRIDLEEGRYADAAARLEQVPAAHRDSILYCDARALALEGLGRWSEAATAYEAAYRRVPSQARLVAWLDGLVLAGRTQDARDALEAERARFPGQPALQDVAARLYTHLGDQGAAIRELEAALLHRPQSVALRRRLANAYMTARRYDQAIPIWRELVSCNPVASGPRTGRLQVDQRHTFRRQWATSLLAAGEYANAAHIYRVMTLTQPEDAGAQVGLAAATLAAGRPAEAVESARRALELQPDNREARLALACAYTHLNQRSKAVEVLSASARDGKTDALVRELLTRLRSTPPTAGK